MSLNRKLHFLKSSKDKKPYDFKKWTDNLGIEHIKMLKDDHDENGTWSVDTPGYKPEPYKVPTNPKFHLQKIGEMKELMERHINLAKKAMEDHKYHSAKAKESQAKMKKHEEDFKKAMEQKGK